MKTRMKSADDIWAQAIMLVSEQAKRDYERRNVCEFPSKEGMARIEKIRNIALRYSENIGKYFGTTDISNEDFEIKVERKVYMI